jgi:hypothetical protein
MSLFNWLFGGPARPVNDTRILHWADEEYARGVYPLMLICGPVPGVNLKVGETIQACVPNTTLMEPRAVRRYQAGSRGVSIRVMKGLSFRVGGYAGQSESHEELRSIDVGTLVLTNERLLFVGSKRTTNIRLADLVTVEAYADALRISRQGKAKPEFYALDLNQRLVSGSGAGLPIHHAMIKVAIEAASQVDSMPEDQFYIEQTA